ncbi:DUF2244 domain-containing protein [Marinobacter caseinilyticus]|uniref:DUF2244 domain-containing protein n=1 Tax=Marinobacter caseinilyticus TaxID=2692195 RepID=UPI00140DCBCA|nr:DUF2244 domain-containing protein [Marinobacter caseinilyticus]
MVKHLQCNDGVRLLLTPNRSISWRAAIKVWLALCAVSLTVVVGMIWAGAWVVVPFAGLELTALGAALYYTARKCQQQEVLSISADTLHLEKGRYRKEIEWDMPKRFTRVYIDSPKHPWVPQKLTLIHRDTEVALANFLNIDDSAKLVSILESQGLNVQRRRELHTGLWF